MNIDKVKAMGKYWEKDSLKRVYYGDLNSLINLKLNLRKDGNIQRAYLDGKRISIKEAKKLDCRGKDFYFDLKLGMFQYDDTRLNGEAIELLLKVFK